MFRFVIANKRVVPQHDATTKCVLRTGVVRKPCVESPLRIMRQTCAADVIPRNREVKKNAPVKNPASCSPATESSNRFFPNRSTEPSKPRFERPDRSFEFARCSNSPLSNAMFTCDGHSFRHALHDRQLLKASSSAGELIASSSFRARRNSSTARIVFAPPPRVDMISSPVAMNVGHIVGASLRHAPAAVALLEVAHERFVPSP